MPRTRVRVQYEPCQRMHHSWYDGTDPDWVPAFGLVGEVQICDRCGTVRRRGIDSLGRVATNQYIWPDGYSMARDERPSKEQLRKDWYAAQKAAQRKKARRLRSVAS